MAEQKSEFLAAHEELVEQVLQNQPEDEYLYDLAELFKVFRPGLRSYMPCLKVNFVSVISHRS